MDKLEVFITVVSDTVLILGALSPLLLAIVRYAKAHTTDKRIQVLESYAERVVSAVEQQVNLMPSDKKKLASKRLADYINKSKLGLKVTDEQLNDLIESAVNKLSDNTTAGTKKESTALPVDNTEKPEEKVQEVSTDADKVIPEANTEVPSVNELLK